MGHELTREVKAGAPPGWTANMRLVALAIADEANDRSRRTIGYRAEGHWRDNGKGWRDGISEHTGLSPRMIQHVLQDLARAGYDMRVPICTGRDGRPVYSARGRATTFQVPPIAARMPPERVPADGALSGERVPAPGTLPAERVPADGTPISSEEHHLRSTSPHPPASLRLAPEPAPNRESGGTVPQRRRKTNPPKDQAPLWPAPVATLPAVRGTPVIETSTRGGGPAGSVARQGPLGFDDFWRSYPRRVAKGAARKAWEAVVVKGKADPARVVAGAGAYAAERAGQDPRFTKHPATWLRAECWDDEPLQAVPGDPVAALRATLSPPDQNVLDHLALAARLDRQAQ